MEAITTSAPPSKIRVVQSALIAGKPEMQRVLKRNLPICMLAWTEQTSCEAHGVCRAVRFHPGQHLSTQHSTNQILEVVISSRSDTLALHPLQKKTTVLQHQSLYLQVLIELSHSRVSSFFRIGRDLQPAQSLKHFLI